VSKLRTSEKNIISADVLTPDELKLVHTKIAAQVHHENVPIISLSWQKNRGIHQTPFLQEHPVFMYYFYVSAFHTKGHQRNTFTNVFTRLSILVKEKLGIT